MWILAKILCEITGAPRYKPTIRWARNSWTVNAFRVYELLFWRRVGIRRESLMTKDEFGNVKYTCYSWEAKIAFAEWRLREALKTLKWQPIRITVPVLVTPGGFRYFASPYVFAIAFDNVVIKTLGASPNTQAFTVTGSDPYLVGAAWVGSVGYSTAYSYNSVAATKEADVVGSVGASYYHSMWYLLNPATGSNTISVSAPSSVALAATSYSGVAGGREAGSTNTNLNSSTISTSTTVVASNCWLVSSASCDGNPTGGGTNNTQRTSALGNWFMGDSNATVGTGAQTATTACATGAGNYNSMITISISPTAGGGGGAPAAVQPTLLLLGAA